MSTTFTHPDVDRDAVVDRLQAAGFVLGTEEPLLRTAIDTFDGHLHQAGLRLELRRSSTSELTLSGAADAPVARLTVEDAPVVTADLPPGPFRERLASHTGTERLLPILGTISRHTVAVRRDRRGKVTVVVSIHDDLGVRSDTPAGAPSGPASELPTWAVEVHPVIGHADDAEQAIEQLGALGLTPCDGDLIPLVAQRSGVDLATRSSSPTVPLDHDEPAHDGFRRTLANLAATVERNREGTIADLDPEFLHELRVAVRRTRSVLAQGRGVLPDPVRDYYREAFSWLGEQTGPSRDLDVYVIEWDHYVAPLSPDAVDALTPVLAQIELRRRAAHAELADVLRSDRFRATMTAWERWLSEPAVPTKAGGKALGPVVARRIDKAQRRLLEHGRAITPDSEPERLHDLRKDAKKLRYLIECFGDLFAKGPRKTFVRRLKDLQDNLGEHQDAEVHVQQLAGLAADLHDERSVEVGSLLAMGRLTESLERRRRSARVGFGERFAAYDTATTQGALDDLVDGLRSDR